MACGCNKKNKVNKAVSNATNKAKKKMPLISAPKKVKVKK